MSHKTCSWTYALTDFTQMTNWFTRATSSSSYCCTWCTHERPNKTQPSAHTNGWHERLETVDVVSGFTKVQIVELSVRKPPKGGIIANYERKKSIRKGHNRKVVKISGRAAEYRGGKSSRSFRVDEQPIRLPDELQLNHNPLNGDKHTPVSPVCLPQTPLNDCKH